MARAEKRGRIKTGENTRLNRYCYNKMGHAGDQDVSLIATWARICQVRFDNFPS